MATFNTFSLINTGAGLDATNITSGSCDVYGIDCMNSGNSPVFLKIYSKSTTPTTADTPVRRYMIPATGGLVRLFSAGLPITAGLGFMLSAAITDADNTNVNANTVVINIDWG